MRRIRRKIYKFWLKTKKRLERYDFTQSFPVTDTQELGEKVFEKAIARTDAELLLAPLSNTYYIKSDDIFIILDGLQLKIINGRYEYHITLTEKIHNKLSAKFKRVLENRRKKMEEQMLSKTNRSLQTILQELE
jgi:hypothetical protein